MKDTKSFLLVVLILAACAAPATPAPTQTFAQEPAPLTSTVEFSDAASAPVTPDPAMGNIEGELSWSTPTTSANVPITHVNLEINGHSGGAPRYTTKVDPNGHFTFVNIEPGNYGFGIYFNLPVSARLCETPEYLYGTDLEWLHYATALRGDIWYDILFSSKDVVIDPGEIVVMDFVLKCP